ncbi:hypothetical protein M885DRAFT_626247 [Pelagophyceae sp. CCMP2097]|nr:hypothetical protein M885DRAFT_626247 [Pelagophyceae sp. CCMP2097]
MGDKQLLIELERAAARAGTSTSVVLEQLALQSTHAAEWVECWDDSEQCYYYYNEGSGESRWELPVPETLGLTVGPESFAHYESDGHAAAAALEDAPADEAQHEEEAEIGGDDDDDDDGPPSPQGERRLALAPGGSTRRRRVGGEARDESELTESEAAVRLACIALAARECVGAATEAAVQSVCGKWLDERRRAWGLKQGLTRRSKAAFRQTAQRREVFAIENYFQKAEDDEDTDTASIARRNGEASLREACARRESEAREAEDAADASGPLGADADAAVALAQHLDATHAGLRGGALRCVDVSDCSLGDDCVDGGVSLLASALAGSSASVVDAQFNGIGSDGAALIAKALKQCTALHEVHLGCNDIGDRGVQALCEALLTPITVLSALNLAANPVSCHGAFVVARHVADKRISLTTLRLGGAPPSKRAFQRNGLDAVQAAAVVLGDAGAAVLAAALLANGGLTSLALTHAGIGAKGAFALAAALLCEPALKYLDLSGNPLEGAALAGPLPRRVKMMARSRDRLDNKRPAPAEGRAPPATVLAHWRESGVAALGLALEATSTLKAITVTTDVAASEWLDGLRASAPPADWARRTTLGAYAAAAREWLVAVGAQLKFHLPAVPTRLESGVAAAGGDARGASQAGAPLRDALRFQTAPESDADDDDDGQDLPAPLGTSQRSRRQGLLAASAPRVGDDGDFDDDALWRDMVATVDASWPPRSYRLHVEGDAATAFADLLWLAVKREVAPAGAEWSDFEKVAALGDVDLEQRRDRAAAADAVVKAAALAAADARLRHADRVVSRTASQKSRDEARCAVRIALAAAVDCALQSAVEALSDLRARALAHTSAARDRQAAQLRAASDTARAAGKVEAKRIADVHAAQQDLDRRRAAAGGTAALCLADAHVVAAMRMLQEADALRRSASDVCGAARFGQALMQEAKALAFDEAARLRDRVATSSEADRQARSMLEAHDGDTRAATALDAAEDAAYRRKTLDAEQFEQLARDTAAARAAEAVCLEAYIRTLRAAASARRPAALRRLLLPMPCGAEPLDDELVAARRGLRGAEAGLAAATAMAADAALARGARGRASSDLSDTGVIAARQRLEAALGRLEEAQYDATALAMAFLPAVTASLRQRGGGLVRALRPDGVALSVGFKVEVVRALAQESVAAVAAQQAAAAAVLAEGMKRAEVAAVLKSLDQRSPRTQLTIIKVRSHELKNADRDGGRELHRLRRKANKATEVLRAERRGRRGARDTRRLAAHTDAPAPAPAAADAAVPEQPPQGRAVPRVPNRSLFRSPPPAPDRDRAAASNGA